MTAKTTTQGIACALLLYLGASSAWADAAPMSKDDYQAAQERIEQRGKAERKACRRQEGRARELCELAAKGREKVALAKLDAQYEPSHEADRRAKEVQADADLALARAKCKALRGQARDGCVEKAESVHEAMLRLAVVEKVERIKAEKRAERAQQKAAEEAAARKAGATPQS